MPIGYSVAIRFCLADGLVVGLAREALAHDFEGRTYLSPLDEPLDFVVARLFWASLLSDRLLATKRLEHMWEHRRRVLRIHRMSVLLLRSRCLGKRLR